MLPRMASDMPGTPLQAPVQLLDGAEVEPRAVGGVYKVTFQTFVSTLLPRDVMVTTAHYQDQQGTKSPAQAATDWGAAMLTYLTLSNAGGTVKIYLEDFNPAAPHVPLAVANFGVQTNFFVAAGPRELGLCLSYYATQNTKRYRGRNYIPYSWIYSNMVSKPTTVAERPTAGMIGSALAFHSIVLRANNTAGWVHGVASHVDKALRLTTDYWVDDEWDIQRRRGLKGTTRQTAHP